MDVKEALERYERSLCNPHTCFNYLQYNRCAAGHLYEALGLGTMGTASSYTVAMCDDPLFKAVVETIATWSPFKPDCDSLSPALDLSIMVDHYSRSYKIPHLQAAVALVRRARQRISADEHSVRFHHRIPAKCTVPPVELA